MILDFPLKSVGPAVLLLSSAACAQPASETTLSNDGYAQLDACLSDVLTAQGFHGVATVGRFDDIIFETAMDAHNGDTGTFEVTSRFNTGSMFKMITAVAVLQLVERDALSLDDTLGEHVDDLPGALQAIRVSDLLSHTSGMGNYLSPQNLDVIKNHDSLDELLALIVDDEPGEAGNYRYSNSGYLMLGVLIEAVSGHSYEQFITSSVLEPAGMRSTGLLPDANTAQASTRMVPGQRPGEGDTSDQPFRPSHLSGGRGMPAGGAYTTTGDLYRFAQALMSGELVSPATFDLMRTAHALAREGDDGAIYYGYGLNIRDNGSSLGHAGGGPGINGELRFQPDNNWIIATLTNIDPRMASEANSALERALSDPTDPGYCFE